MNSTGISATSTTWRIMPKRKPYWKMTTAELKAATAEFDREDLSPGKPLTAADKAQHRRAAARAKLGRPIVGKGAKTVPVTIERGLLKEADAFAKERGLKRSQMVAQGLRLVMQFAKAS